MNKKIRFVILILILILLVLIIRSTYSKYYNKAEGQISETVGKWIIKVNDKDITKPDENGELGVFVIDSENFAWDWDSATHVKAPKVAPGMEGYFNLKIDPTGTQVSIKYTITIDDSKIEEMLKNVGTEGENLIDRLNLKITGLKENGVEIEELPRDEEGNIVITKIKTLDEISSEVERDRVDDLQIQVTWVNDENNNDIDSKLGSVANNIIKLPIKIDVIQWLGDEP